MIPQTVGREFDVGKVAQVQCIKNDTLKDIEIKGHCFLMLVLSLEKEFGFEWDDDMLSISAFSSTMSILEYVESKVSK